MEPRSTQSLLRQWFSNSHSWWEARVEGSTPKSCSGGPSLPLRSPETCGGGEVMLDWPFLFPCRCSWVLLLNNTDIGQNYDWIIYLETCADWENGQTWFQSQLHCILPLRLWPGDGTSGFLSKKENNWLVRLNERMYVKCLGQCSAQIKMHNNFLFFVRFLHNTYIYISETCLLLQPSVGLPLLIYHLTWRSKLSKSLSINESHRG